MNAHRHKIRRPRKRKDYFSSLVVFLLIGSMIFYQLLPLSIAIAEDTMPDSTPSTDSGQASSPQAAAETESQSPPEEEEPDPEPAEEKTPPAEEEEAEKPEADAALGSETALAEEPIGEEPAEVPTETTIENTNAAVVQNEAGLIANTGENAANENTGEKSDPCEKEAEPENPEGSAETVSEENEASEEEPAVCPMDEEEEEIAPAEETATLQTEATPPAEETAAVVPPAENLNSQENSEEGTEEESSGQAEESAPETVPEPANPANQLYGGPAEPVLGETETPAEESAEPVAEITTGDAQAVVNIFNDVNANLTGANWESLILNIEGAESEDIDLLREFLKLLEKAGQPDENSENSGTTEIKNDNNAEVTNNVTVEANSGINTADSNGGGATIETGDASALANIVNFLNRNFTGNNWLFAVINIFGSLSGNIIVPGEGLLTLPGSGCGSGCLGNLSEVSNSNSADIDNNVTAVANTGGNVAEGNQGGAEIVTGSAVAVAEVKNIANTNITESHNWFFLLINNMGSWVGKVLNWNAESNSYETAYSYAFEGDGSGDPSDSTFSVENLNVAKVTNNVTVLANTGDNSASGNAGGASIRTGNAGAFANILNFVNANITGNNWFFGMINILGEWTGNLEFAYPDLQVSISDGKNSAEAGDTLVYQIKYKNTGKADAENVQLKAAFSNYVSGDDQAWDIGPLAAGQEGAYEVQVKIADPMPAGKSVLESAAGITTATREVEGSNNTAADYTDVVYDSTDSTDDEGDFDPGLKIGRNGSSGQVLYPGNIIHHEIIVENSGDGPIMDIVVKDKVADSAGNHLTTLTWQAGDLKQGKRLLITYDLLINSSIVPGSYSYSATAQGEDYFGDEVESKKANIQLAIGRLLGGTALASAEPETAAAATEVSGAVLGEEFPLERGFPLWIWMLAAAAYYLSINWSLFPKRQRF